MLRDGPTWQHQALARQTGVLPTSAVFTFFAARWEAATVAEEAMHLAERIVNATERPDVEAAERLAYLLDRFATDEAFAYNLLTALGPEGLVTLYGNVALMQRAGTRDEVDLHLADLQVAIQNADLVARQFEYAAYDSGALTELPPEFVVDGKLRPRTSWDNELLIDYWELYLGSTDEGRLMRQYASRAADEYRDSLAYFRTVEGF